MCCFKSLCTHEHGYVVRCASCDHIHVGFGSTVLAFSQDQFCEFVNTIQGYYDYNKDTDQPEVKSIQIPTVARSIFLLYSFKELALFRDLLQKARESFKREKLFVFNEN